MHPQIEHSAKQTNGPLDYTNKVQQRRLGHGVEGFSVKIMDPAVKPRDVGVHESSFLWETTNFVYVVDLGTEV